MKALLDFFHVFVIIIIKSEGSKSSTHYLGDKNRFDVSGIRPFDEGPLLETSNLFLSPR